MWCHCSEAVFNVFGLSGGARANARTSANPELTDVPLVNGNRYYSYYLLMCSNEPGKRSKVNFLTMFGYV